MSKMMALGDTPKCKAMVLKPYRKPNAGNGWCPCQETSGSSICTQESRVYVRAIIKSIWWVVIIPMRKWEIVG